MTATFDEQEPENIEDLKRRINSFGDYKDRKSAVDDLASHKCRKSIDILWNVMMNDPIHSVQNHAFLKLQLFGEKVKLPKKNPKHLKKAVEKLKASQKHVDFFEDQDGFMKYFMGKYPKEHEVILYEKKDKSLKFISGIISYLPKK